MYKRFLISFMIFIFTTAPIQARAEGLEGKVTALSQNEEAPFSGVLLDPIAASKMIVDQKFLRLEIELGLRKEYQKELSDKRLSFDLLKVEYDSLKKIHEETLSIRDQQINDLNLLLKEEIGNDSNHWWTFGGMAAGIILSVAVFYASVEIANK